MQRQDRKGPRHIGRSADLNAAARKAQVGKDVPPQPRPTPNSRGPGQARPLYHGPAPAPCPPSFCPCPPANGIPDEFIPCARNIPSTSALSPSRNGPLGVQLSGPQKNGFTRAPFISSMAGEGMFHKRHHPARSVGKADIRRNIFRVQDRPFRLNKPDGRLPSSLWT